MSLAAPLLGAAKTIPVDNRRIVLVGFRATARLPYIIRSMQGSGAVQATALAATFRQIGIALFQKLKETHVRQVALAAFLSVFLFHTLRRRENPPQGKPPRGVLFLKQLQGALRLSLTYRERTRRFIPRFPRRCSVHGRARGLVLSSPIPSCEFGGPAAW